MFHVKHQRTKAIAEAKEILNTAIENERSNRVYLVVSETNMLTGQTRWLIEYHEKAVDYQTYQTREQAEAIADIFNTDVWKRND